MVPFHRYTPDTTIPAKHDSALHPGGGDLHRCRDEDVVRAGFVVLPVQAVQQGDLVDAGLLFRVQDNGQLGLTLHERLYNRRRWHGYLNYVSPSGFENEAVQN